MEYRTILVHVDASAHASARVRLAAAIAGSHGAHLVGAAMTGMSRFVCPEGYACKPGTVIAGYLEPLYDGANRMLDQFEAAARTAGATSVGRRLVADQPDDGLARQAPYADLVVLSQNDPDESTSDYVTSLPEYVVLNCTRPVLIVPHTGQVSHVGRSVLVAWNGSKEATAALSGAIPLMRGAGQVRIVRFGPSAQDSAKGVEPERDLVAYLARHQVHAEVLARPGVPEADDALLSLAAEFQCDLIVMGCYGHTRFRELMLGGATRMVLRSMKVPVLMAH
jgi:nucleotide-binding universal stress UspA family protein